jgi:hypothetical protein
MAYHEDLGYRLGEILCTEDGLSEQPMYGGLAFLLNGNMALSASSKGGLLLRVDPVLTAKLLTRAHTRPFVMREKEMAGWLRVEHEGIRTKRDLQRWVRIGVDFAQSLPPERTTRRAR